MGLDKNLLTARLEAAQRVADAAAAIIRPLFKSDSLQVDYKEAVSPIVTQADRDSEAAMRLIIEAEFPEDTIIGEEHGVKEGTSGFAWILDPIDGTIAFTVGKPVFGTLIGLACQGEFELGIIDQAVLGERFLGLRDQGSSLNGEVLSTSGRTELNRAKLAFTSPLKDPGIERIIEAVHVTSYGGDCYNYALLASGYLDIVIERGLNLYDYAALVPVVEGAGGVITDWQGRSLSQGGGSDVIACATRALQDQVLSMLT
ncbi:MAG: inositol monophosphatase family protein [Cyanobacteriota/Melainabacteria group bacterium]|nr:histidinol phosphate phosphatase [Cyanobacteria bacterium HKST-UBA01]MCB9468657.1 histidinol phosphate phosphatase [Candidatus Obscuribacterales bacterium]